MPLLTYTKPLLPVYDGRENFYPLLAAERAFNHYKVGFAALPAAHVLHTLWLDSARLHSVNQFGSPVGTVDYAQPAPEFEGARRRV